MGTRERTEEFETEAEARERAEQVKASAIPGYSEVYVGPVLNICGVWMFKWEEYYG